MTYHLDPTPMKLNSKASIQIQKPIAEVYEGIVAPEKMTQYFISESSGRLETRKEVVWKFPEFPDRFPITEVVLEPNQSISFRWDPETTVTITLGSQPDNSTVVKVSEYGKENNEANLEWLTSNAGGWANFLVCLKAYLEYGINLRKGAYQFMMNE